LALANGASAFVPASHKFSSNTELYAESRREAIGSMFALGGLLLGGLGAPQESLAASNPALQTFKGRKENKGSYIPGMYLLLICRSCVSCQLMFSDIYLLQQARGCFATTKSTTT
jgi:hypothetical protein